MFPGKTDLEEYFVRFIYFLKFKPGSFLQFYESIILF